MLCDGNPNASPLTLDGGVYADPSIQKIIRNCTFDHIVGSHAIRIRNARNVLIEGNTFLDIHSGTAGVGQHAIAIPGSTAADNVVVRGNTFSDIGADGLQISDGGRLTTNIVIEDNDFYYSTISKSWTGGENAVDVKGSNGPVVIRRNLVDGFLPCDPGDECSGSNGVGIVVHDGGASGRARNTTLESNLFSHNVIGLNVTDADQTSIINNTFVDNGTHVRVTSAAAGCTHSGNVFLGTGTVAWGPCVGP